MLELDHLIAFLPGPPDPPDGLLLDAGTRHVGQGTRNRRIVFPRHYVELLWTDEPEAERASGPGFAARCPHRVPVRDRAARHGARPLPRTRAGRAASSRPG